MKISQKLTRILYITGIVAMLIGTIDPLEGSVVIAGGSLLLFLATWLSHDPQRNLFLMALILIVTGIIALFYLSSLGGFGGNSALSWWWGAFILPYPAGWLLTIILLIIRAVRKKKEPAPAQP